MSQPDDPPPAPAGPTVNLVGGRAALRAGPAASPARREPEPGDPARWNCLIAAPFAGRRRTGEEPAAPWRLTEGGIPEALRALSPAIRVAALDRALRFEDPDHFHPDHLAPLLASTSDGPTPTPTPAPSATGTGAVEAEGGAGGGGGSLLDRILAAGNAPAAERPLARASDAMVDDPELAAFVRRVAASSRVAPASGAGSGTGGAGVDSLDALRAVLADPEFRRLEEVWTGADLLFRAFGLDDAPRIALWPVPDGHWSDDVAAAESLARTLTGRTLVLIPRTFRPSIEDARLMARLCGALRDTRSALIADADPAFLGCPSLLTHPDPDDWTAAPDPVGLAAWTALGRTPEARRAALVVPRALVRAPYDPRSNPLIRHPDFREWNDGDDPGKLPWGSAVHLAAAILESNARAGVPPGGPGVVDGLASRHDRAAGRLWHVEAPLNDRADRIARRAGITPMRGSKADDRLVVESWTSIAGTPFEGPWT